ncbi:MAG: hypothetical protein ACLP9S_13790 [Syntrophales bacterium]
MKEQRIEKKEAVEGIIEKIQGCTRQINTCREKAYVLQQLFNSEAGALDTEISIDHIGLILSGAETILGEIVADTGEAGEHLLNLTFSQLLKAEVTA